MSLLLWACGSRYGEGVCGNLLAHASSCDPTTFQRHSLGEPSAHGLTDTQNPGPSQAKSQPLVPLPCCDTAPSSTPAVPVTDILGVANVYFLSDSVRSK